MLLPQNTDGNESSVPQDQEPTPAPIMGPETNIYSIRALEEQIKEGKGDVIKLKRARNSLLNISARVPPEILGRIFVFSLVRKAGRSPYHPHIVKLTKGCYNFLLVCHYWFDVAFRTPELWSFWGDTLEEWKKCHHRPGATPLDLVLDDSKVVRRGPIISERPCHLFDGKK